MAHLWSSSQVLILTLYKNHNTAFRGGGGGGFKSARDRQTTNSPTKAEIKKLASKRRAGNTIGEVFPFYSGFPRNMSSIHLTQNRTWPPA